MTRCTRGLCIGCGGVVAFALLVGCAQNGRQGASTRTASRTAVAAPAQPTNVITAAAGVVTSAATAVTGAVTGAVNGAVAGANGTQTATAHRPQIKQNGRGGFDSSELQADAIRRAHASTAYYSARDRARAAAARSKSTTRPSY